MTRFIYQFVLPYWPYYLGGLIALIITNYIITVIPLKIQQVIDLIIANDTPTSIKHALILIVGLAILLALSRTLSRVLIFFPGRFVEYDLRNVLFSKLLTLSTPFYRNQKIGDLLSRLINDMQSLRATAALGFLHIINTLMIYIFVFIQMVRIHPPLSFWILLPVPFTMSFVGFFVKYMYTYTYQCQQALGTISTFFVDIFTNIKTIKTTHAVSAITPAFHKKNNDLYKKNIALATIRSGMFPFINSIGAIGHFVLLLMGGSFIINGSLTVGEFVALSSYVTLLSWPTASLAWIINIIQRGKAAWRRIEVILNSPPSFQGTSVLPPPTTGLCFTVKNLSFSYHNNPILHDLSFSIEAGQSIGIFGPSGSGKSVLVRLLAGIEKAPDPAIAINRMPLNSLALTQYHQHLAYVSESPFLFSATIEENIRFGDTKLSIESAITHACLTADIAQFPTGKDTLVGEKGVILSGGQRARLALARAYYKDASVLILDDVFSAIDHETERNMLTQLYQYKKPTQTLIMVSHRISALTQCDHIICLHQGTLQAQGSHQELLAQQGVYYKTLQYQKMIDTYEKR